MEENSDPSSPHSRGEMQKVVMQSLDLSANQTVIVDTLGRRMRVEWDPEAPVTPLGQLVFFSQFLATAGIFFRIRTNVSIALLQSECPVQTGCLSALRNRFLAMRAVNSLFVYNY